MSRFNATLLYFVAGAMGVATMAAIGYQWFPPGVIAVAFAIFFILTLPRQARLVTAFSAGPHLPSPSRSSSSGSPSSSCILFV